MILYKVKGFSKKKKKKKKREREREIQRRGEKFKTLREMTVTYDDVTDCRHLNTYYVQGIGLGSWE